MIDLTIFSHGEKIKVQIRSKVTKHYLNTHYYLKRDGAAVVRNLYVIYCSVNI